MKSLLVTSGVILYALSMAACTADEPPAGPATSAAAGDPATAAESKAPDVLVVPPELSFAQLPEGTVVGNQFDSTTDACRVRLEYCADPRWSPHYPSFCQSGCGLDHGFAVARSLCRSICGSINCDTMYYLGGC